MCIKCDKYSFKITSGDKIYHIKAKSGIDMDGWYSN